MSNELSGSRNHESLVDANALDVNSTAAVSVRLTSSFLDGEGAVHTN